MRQVMLGAAAAAFSLGGAGSAQDWQALDGAAIAEALTDRLLRYENGSTQRFHASGRTLYTFGEPSWGEWRVESDRYCSLWPPAAEWDCYEVYSDGAGGVDFADAFGNRFPGVIVGE